MTSVRTTPANSSQANAASASELLDKVGPRAKPLIITVFGDTIAPRGGTIWLGSLIELMQSLGLSERLVRTGVYRLVREGWLKARQNGRRSFYTITRDGLDSFAEADARIYANGPLTWDNKWTMVQTLPDATPKDRKKMRNLLTWHGFGQLSPTMMIKPGSDTKNLNQVLKAANLANASIIFISDLDQHADKQSIIANGWSLQNLSDAYERLLCCFADTDKPATNNKNTKDSDQNAFITRSLLIHQYRRILLKDPQLPNELLPPEWNGEKARQLVAQTYRTLSPQADRFIIEKMQCGNKQCPSPTSAYHSRFISV